VNLIADAAEMTDEQLSHRLALIELRGAARELSLSSDRALVVAVGLDDHMRRVGDNAYFHSKFALIRRARQWPVFCVAYKGVIIAWREGEAQS
jgi:hypothetical protein